jgi:hypothetical protein
MERRDDETRVGVAWYAEAEWQRLREIAADPEVLETTYAEWRKVVDKTLRDLAAACVVAERVDVAVAELLQWCKREGCRVDASARSAFAAELLRRRYEGTGGTSGA